MSVDTYFLRGICAPQETGGVTRDRIGSSVEKEPASVLHIPGIM